MKFILILTLVMTSFFSHADETTKQVKLKELLRVMDMDSMVDTMYSQMEIMTQNMSSQMGVQPSEQAIFDDYHSKMNLAMRESMSWEKMEPEALKIYQDNFTESEIEDMLAFYKSDTGKSILKKMPKVMQESMQMGQSLMQETIPKIQAIAKDLSENLKKSRQAKEKFN